MLERLIIAIALIAIGVFLYRLLVAFQLSRASSTLPGLEEREDGKYFILYFTSPTCEPCRTAQRPALQVTQEAFGDQLQIVTVDITQKPEIAAQWKVMTLPTTYLFDTRGKPRTYNPGVTYSDRLIQQIIGMGAKERRLQQTSV